MSGVETWPEREGFNQLAEICGRTEGHRLSARGPIGHRAWRPRARGVAETPPGLGGRRLGSVTWA